MLLNLEKHDFGIQQNQERVIIYYIYFNFIIILIYLINAKNKVHNVELPPWCKRNPYLFTVMHRKALESEIVS